jgi:hypothetical protein
VSDDLVRKLKGVLFALHCQCLEEKENVWYSNEAFNHLMFQRALHELDAGRSRPEDIDKFLAGFVQEFPNQIVQKAKSEQGKKGGKRNKPPRHNPVLAAWIKKRRNHAASVLLRQLQQMDEQELQKAIGQKTVPDIKPIRRRILDS